MVYYFVLIASFFIIVFFLRFKRIAFYLVAEYSVALVNDLIADVDDELKIKQVQSSTNKLSVALLKMLVIVVIAFVLGSLPVIMYCFLTHTDINSLDFTSFYAILSVSAGATLPFLIPTSKKTHSGYSELSQLLHRMALNNYNIAYKLFRRETKKIERRGLKNRNDFVIVSGLARAGTTSLMNDLSKIDDFVSLNYANMPFVMCPNYWAKFYKPKSAELKERSHKDGIMIGLDSNEALEEYFFKVKAYDSFVKEHSLTMYAIPEGDYKDYLAYQSIIKLNNSKIYLAKNNNFILRYKSVREFNEDFVMVILYREPLTHAASLLEKHLEYKKLQKDDPFVLEYMNWLGHHEFGLNQKPFSFGNSEEYLQGEKESMDYWLKNWINYYSYVLTIDHPNTLLVNYEAYCQHPEATIKSILNKLNLATDLPEYNAFENKRIVEIEYTESIYKSAAGLYGQLNTRANF